MGENILKMFESNYGIKTKEFGCLNDLRYFIYSLKTHQ